MLLRVRSSNVTDEFDDGRDVVDETLVVTGVTTYVVLRPFLVPGVSKMRTESLHWNPIEDRHRTKKVKIFVKRT